MGKRGPKCKVSEDNVQKAAELYQAGQSHRAIAKELNVSETNIRRILKTHGIPKRDRKRVTILSSEGEIALVNYINSQSDFEGTYRDLIELMKHFTDQNGWNCPYTYSWRDHFRARHAERLSEKMLKLLSKGGGGSTGSLAVETLEELTEIARAVRGADALVFRQVEPDFPVVDHSVGPKTPSVWKKKKISPVERAIRESKKAFMKAGMNKEEALDLLVRLKVPDVLAKVVAKQVQVQQNSHLPQGATNEASADVVAAAMSNVFGETQMEPHTLQQINQVHQQQNLQSSSTEGLFVVLHEPVPTPRKPVARKNPQKKNQIQTNELEKCFARSPVCGDIRAKNLADALQLTPEQVIYWFHNTARQRRKKVEPAEVLEMQEDAGLPEDFTQLSQEQQHQLLLQHVSNPSDYVF
ncbi:hypothetical protein RvY_03945 [Ramazzottius varieornatus]|uniref:Homeobox domain-containing protein n=1 Tax=Ramazzottius varieornatus TaxID=947166 RepID=A0A1D1UPU5_RAMVA|nr:hypothetical protein RvY_03945 [Ramazzottius varieornatus]